MHRLELAPEDIHNSLGFRVMNGLLNPDWSLGSSSSLQEGISFLLMVFAVPADHGVKIKISEKINKYLDLSWELKKERKKDS